MEKIKKISNKILSYWNKESTNPIESKLLFPIEFSVSIFFTILTLKILTTKQYSGYWSLKYLLEITPFAIILFLCLIENIRINRKKIENLWIGFLIPVGMLFLFFMLPTYAPDEQSHMWKAYEISNGIFVTPIREDGSGATMIPTFLVENKYPHLNKYHQLFEKIQMYTDYSFTVRVSNSANSYFPGLYIFSTVGLLFGRIINLNGLCAQYIARLCNYIIFLLLGYYSMKKIPFGKMVIGVLLFMPMVLQQGTSISADCILNAVAIFFIAYTLNLRFKEQKITRKRKDTLWCYVYIFGSS